MAQQSPPPGDTPPAKRTWRVTNWADYNRALVARGGVTLWLHEEVLRDWRAVGAKGLRYSDAVILSAPDHSGGLQAAFAANAGVFAQPQDHAWAHDPGAALRDPVAVDV